MANTLAAITIVTGTTSGVGTSEDFAFSGGTTLSKMFSIVTFSPAGGVTIRTNTHLKASRLTSASNLQILAGAPSNAPQRFYAQIISWTAGSDISVTRYAVAWTVHGQAVALVPTIPQKRALITYGGLVNTGSNQITRAVFCGPNPLDASPVSSVILRGGNVPPPAGSTVYFEAIDWGNITEARFCPHTWGTSSTGTIVRNSPSFFYALTPNDTNSIAYCAHFFWTAGGTLAASNVQARTNKQYGPQRVVKLYLLFTPNGSTTGISGQSGVFDPAFATVQKKTATLTDPNLIASSGLAGDPALLFVFPGTTFNAISTGRGATTDPLGAGDFRNVAVESSIVAGPAIQWERLSAGAGAESVDIQSYVVEWLGPVELKKGAYYYRRMGQG